MILRVNEFVEEKRSVNIGIQFIDKFEQNIHFCISVECLKIKIVKI